MNITSSLAFMVKIDSAIRKPIYFLLMNDNKYMPICGV